jgi:phosphoesterase RecJ-like protein
VNSVSGFRDSHRPATPARGGGALLPAQRPARGADAVNPSTWSEPPTEADWQAVLDLLAGADEICLACHVSPDGDALGSAIAVGLGLRQLGKQVLVSYGDDPFHLPRTLTFLPGQDLLVPPEKLPARPELMLVFDSASISRLGLLEANAAAARALVVVDHHASNTGFGTHHLVDVTAPATVVLVEELLRRLGVELNLDMATAIYTGLASDTGSFRYQATTPATHRLAARLLELGVRQDEISQQIWDTSRFGYLKLLAAALERSRLDQDAGDGLGLVWTVVPRADRERFGVGLDEIEGLIDVVRKAAEAEVTLVLKEDEDGSYRGSARAKGAVDLMSVCAAFGGGGHRYAAGFATTGSPARIVERFTALLDEAARPAAPAGSTPA